MENVYVFYIASICIHGEDLLRQFAFHQKYRRCNNETDVRYIWEIDNRTIRRDLWNEYNQLGTLFMEVFIFGWWWTSRQSLTRIVSWKGEREPTIKQSMGRKIGVVQKFTGIQNLGQNWWWANGIRVEYIPRIHHIGALHKSPRVTVKIERNTRKVHWTDYLHVDVQRHLMGI